MNKKNKILLTSVGLAVLSGIAATSSTFAWFTTTRTAAISYTNAIVESNQSNLQLTYLGSGNSSFSTAPSLNAVGNTITLVGGNKITDISGDGLAFFKPTWSSVAGEASQILAVSGAAGHYTEVNVKITNIGTASMNVYLGAGTGVTATASPESAAAILAARMAVITGTTVTTGVATGGTLKILHAPNDTAHEYLSAASATAVNVFAPDSSLDDAKKDEYKGTVVGTADFTTATLITGANPNTLVGVLAANGELNVTFRVWLEGEDSDAVNAAIGGVFNFAANLYALDA